MNNKFGTTTLFMAAILLASIACIPAVSASPNKEATETVSAIETPVVESLKGIGILATYYIAEDSTRYHDTDVSSDKHHFKPDLNWIPSSGSLRLTITSPSGVVRGGPWTDGSDGNIDGRIYFGNDIPIEDPSGLEEGEWTSTVYCIDGPVNYSYKVTVT